MFAIAAAAIGFPGGLFSFEINTDVQDVLRVAAIAFIAPALLEELVFRGPLLAVQARGSKHALAFAAAASLALFIIWHPLNATYLLKTARPLFFDPIFLLIAALLGATASIIALTTRSRWCAIFFHWIVVVAWKFCLGGPKFL